MNTKSIFSFMMAAIGCLTLAAATRAQDSIVYVSPSVTAPLYTELGNGNGGSATGTSGDPFGSIQAAYHYLWNKTGSHEVRLQQGASGLYSGASIGYDNNSTYDGIVFLDAAKLPGSPAWSGVTLKPDPTNTLPVTIERVLFFDDRTGKDPTVYESLAANIDRSALFRFPTGDPGFNGMVIEDLTIDLGGGTSIVGSQGTGVQQWTLNNVDVLMRAEYIDTEQFLGGNPWRRSALFNHHNLTAEMSGSFMSFNDSRLYVDPSPGEAGSFYTPGENAGIFMGYRFFTEYFPDGFFDGNGTSEMFLWDSTTAISGEEPYYTGDIWSSQRNPVVLYKQLDTGGVEEGGFVVGFNIVPEPSSFALAGLAGAGLLLMSRLLNRRGRPPEENS